VLLRGAARFGASGVSGPAERARGLRLPLPPLDLVIQDKPLTSISGHLTEMAGLLANVTSLNVGARLVEAPLDLGRPARVSYAVERLPAWLSPRLRDSPWLSP
jgi:hypothetical protein